MFKPINFQNHEKQNKTKQAKYIALSCMLAATTFFTACKKEAQLNSTPVTVEKTINTPSINLKSLSDKGIHVEFTNVRLVFPKIADYEKLANEPNQELKQKYLNEIASIANFKSLKNSKTNIGEVEINSDFLSTILNENFIVQIQDYIIKLDAQKREAYLLEANLENKYYNDLIAQNPPKKTILTFNFDDDVLEAMKVFGLNIRCCSDDINNKASLALCSESGVGGKSDFKYVNSIEFSADYKKFPFYCELEATAYPWGSSSFSYYFDFTGGIPSTSGWVHYKPKCESASSYSILTQGSWKLTKQVYQAYSGTKFLNEIYFGFYVNNSVGTRVSELILIRANK